jgi:DNA-binding helix-hairpin-helix protein with protein kinase domain
VIAAAARELAQAFLHLHTRGFCYRDLSFGNLFLNPHSGQILIADNDNIVVDGTDEDGILGTPRFMAPELVRGEARPCISSDLYSLAVVLFYVLMLHHPLEGRREAAIHSLDLPAMQQLYGRDPLFIFDPGDDSNAPVPGLHDNALTFWPMYPAFVRVLFVRSFTEGLHEPSRRVRETEWRAGMTDLMGLTFACDRCQAELVHPEPFTPAPLQCWQCQGKVQRPLGLRTGSRIVLLQAGRPIDAVQAEVVRHPEHPGRIGLNNLSSQPWRCQLPGQSEMIVVAPGRSVALLPGTRFFWAEPADVCMV